MNEKQITELIERMRELGHTYSYQGAKNLIREYEKLNKPEKVKVPQFVDDVIEGAREHSPELEDALHYAWGNGTKEFTEWYNKKSNNHRTNHTRKELEEAGFGWVFDCEGIEIEEVK